MSDETNALATLKQLAKKYEMDVSGGTVRRSSSRFCFGVEHGDYNGTQLFGVGTDRYIWIAYKPNNSGLVRLVSGNFEADGVITFEAGSVTAPPEGGLSEEEGKSWSRFPRGVDFVLSKKGSYKLQQGFDAVVFGNIPGGGMSRSASLSVNLVLTMVELNKIKLGSDFEVVKLAQMVENEYVGSPCGLLDQIMIYYAKDGMGTHYDPASDKITYIPMGKSNDDVRIAALDTGTVRPGLEKSTYKVRRAECEELVLLLQNKGYKLKSLADVKTPEEFAKIKADVGKENPHLVKRLQYIFEANTRFAQMIEAWQSGNMRAVGEMFRADGHGLRDLYQISGPQLETMCDIARSVPGVLGERMLGGGDFGASGALILAEAETALRDAVKTSYPRSHPDFADDYAVHVCRMVQGIVEFPLDSPPKDSKQPAQQPPPAPAKPDNKSGAQATSDGSNNGVLMFAIGAAVGAAAAFFLARNSKL